MKNPGKIILSVALTLILFRVSYAAGISSELEDDKIAPGESAVLTVKTSGSDVSPTSLPKIDGVSIVYGGSGYSVSIINGSVSKERSLSFVIRPMREGTFTIPPIGINVDGKVFSTEQYTIHSSAKYGAGSNPLGFGGFPSRMRKMLEEDSGMREDVRITGAADVSKQSVYAGEPVILRYSVKSNVSVPIGMKGFSESPQLDGFIRKDFSDQNSKGLIAGFVLIPQASGNYRIGGGKAVVVSDFEQEIQFPQKQVSVKKLPDAGKPADFSGNVGSFEISSDLQNFKCAAFEEKKVIVTVKGRGNFLSIKRPEFGALPEGLKALYEDGEENIQVEQDTLSGEKKFTVTLIAEKEGAFNTGELKFDYFDPSAGVYRIKVLPGASVTVQGIKEHTSSAEKKSSGSYSVIIWISGAALVGIFFILFIILHDRKKYLLADTKPEKEVISDEISSAEIPSDSISRILSIKNDTEFLRETEKYLSLQDDSPEISSLKEHCLKVKYGGGTSGADLIREGLKTLERPK